MSQNTSKLTIALAGLALASLPVLVDAQGTSTQQTRPGQTTSTTSQQNRSSRADQNSPQHHLDEAKRVLSSINNSSLQGDTRSKITELKRHFMQLDSAWRASSAGSARQGASRSTDRTSSGSTAGSASGTAQGTSGTSGTATGSETTEQTGTTAGATTGQRSRGSYGNERSGGKDWMTHYQAIDGILKDLNIESSTGASSATGSSQAGSSTTSSGGTSSGSTAGTSGAGTTGSSGERTGASASASGNIDANVRTKLVEFKRHLDQFHTTAMALSGRGEEDRASADPNSGVTGAMTGTGTSSSGSTASTSQPTTSAQRPEATGTAGTSGTMTGTAGTSGTTAAQGTTGTSGTSGTASGSQTSQTQRPEGTTTQSSASATIDSAAIARLTASIDEMLRGSASTSTTAGTTTGTTGTTSTTGTSGTTSGTAGTSGASGAASATGTVCVDRAKLEELKTQIQTLQNRPR